MCDKDRGLVAPGRHNRFVSGPRARRVTLWLVATTALALGTAACGSKPPEIVAGKMPEGGNFHGVYHSPQYGEMNMVQNGSAVIGEYKQEMRTGKIQGEATGDLMKFEWIERKSLVSNRAQETRGHGYFRYIVDPANGDHILKGEWGLDDAMLGGGPWNAYKAKNKEPKLSQETSSGGESEGEGGDSSSDSSEESDELF
jgi:hypothetical protein